MNDPILGARVEALSQSLILVKRSVKLIHRMIDGGRDANGGHGVTLLHPELRRNLDNEVDRWVRGAEKDLVKIRGLLVGDPDQLPAAWRQYAEIQERSQELFSGCLELIGGAAFRLELGRGAGADEDRRIGDVADELMVAAASAALGRPSPYFTVPALEEALADSRVRTIRLRFPDWTIWNLPLMAYDFGHVAIVEYRGADEDVPLPLQSLLKRLSEQVMEVDAAVQQRLRDAPSKEVQNRIRRRAEKATRARVRVLLADAFATRWIGPSYACAAIHLRFDPSAAYSRNPCFEERAHMVCNILDEMATSDDHRRTATTLRSQWKASVDRADPPDPSSGAPAEVVELVQDAIVGELRELPSATEYAPERWYRAQEKSARWTREFSDTNELTTEPGPDDGLRDVLNAAWLCRLQKTGDKELQKVVAAAALAQCDAIVDKARGRRANAEKGGTLGTYELRGVR